jgi:hypothetical protein
MTSIYSNDQMNAAVRWRPLGGMAVVIHHWGGQEVHHTWVGAVPAVPLCPGGTLAPVQLLWNGVRK